jgi:AcrR family transcriptional regulator
VPKRVDPEERRQIIAAAVYEVIGERGWEAVSLRDVASAAGVSMGQVQHYFTTKTDMLLFALGYNRARVMARLQQELAALPVPTQREQIRAAVRVSLPLDEPSRQEAIVNIAFLSAATVTPAYSQLLRDEYAGVLELAEAQLRAAAENGELRDGVDLRHEAAALFFLLDGLIGPVLIGVLTPQAALDLLDRQLDRIFR